MLLTRLITVLVLRLGVREAFCSACVELELEQEGGRVLWQGSRASPSSCSSSCSARPDCAGWSWRGGRCRLASALASKVARQGSVSGINEGRGGLGGRWCVRGRECHYTDNQEIVNCIEGNITR